MTAHLRFVLLLSLALGTVAPVASAQTPSEADIPPLAPDVALRPFFLFTEQRFAASETFGAVFGAAIQPFMGGGAQLALSNGLYTDVTVSRFTKAGERAFFSKGQSVSLGIPLRATITALEITGGYRFGAEWSSRVIPYVGAGLASYTYAETSDFAEAGDDVDRRRSGYLVVGGAEFRVHRWVVASADVQLTHVGGILGAGGVSQQARENDLGGVAARFRVMIGR